MLAYISTGKCGEHDLPSTLNSALAFPLSLILSLTTTLNLILIGGPIAQNTTRSAFWLPHRQIHPLRAYT